MAMRLYELAGRDNRRFSPYCWRTRMALAHKGLAAELVPCRFTDKALFAFSGQERVPVLVDGDRHISDSWAIACYLEDSYPDRPSLFGGDVGRAEARFINLWTDRDVHLPLLRLVVKDIYDHVDPADREYFRTSREERMGGTLESFHERRESLRPDFDRAVGPLRALLREQPFVCGEAPGYGDYIVFGAYQWGRCISPYALSAPGDGVHEWRERMLDLYGGLARGVPAYSW